MNRPITSINDIAPAYRELPSNWLKVLFWALVPIGVVLAVVLAIVLWQRFFPKDPDKARRDAQIQQFNKAIEKQEKKAAKLIKQKEKIQVKAAKVANDAQAIMDDIDSGNLSLYEQQQLRKRIGAYRAD